MRHQMQNVAEYAAGVSDLTYAHGKHNRTRHGPHPTHYHCEACDTIGPHSTARSAAFAFTAASTRL